MHVGTIVLPLALLGVLAGLGPVYLVGVAAVAMLLVYEQSLVSAGDLSQVKRAFDLNGYVGILYFVVTAISVYAAVAPGSERTLRRSPRGSPACSMRSPAVTIS